MTSSVVSLSIVSSVAGVLATKDSSGAGALAWSNCGPNLENAFRSVHSVDLELGTMDNGNVEAIPNTQELINMMLIMPNQANEQVSDFMANNGCQDTTQVVDNLTTSAITDNNNNENNMAQGNGPNNPIFYNISTDHHQPQFVPDEEDLDQLQSYAQELLTAPHAVLDQAHNQRQLTTNYLDVKVS